MDHVSDARTQELTHRQALQATLRHSGARLSFAQILDILSVELPPADASKVLRACVMADEVRFDYAPAPGNYSGLVFYVDREPASDPYEAQALDDIVRFISQRVDGRGEPWGAADPASLEKALGARHSAPVLMAAVRQGVREGLLHLALQHLNHYMAFSLNDVVAYTALAVDKDSARGTCLHVRAGNEAVAVRKVQAHVHERPALQLLALVPGHWLNFPAFPGAPAMAVVKL